MVCGLTAGGAAAPAAARAARPACGVPILGVDGILAPGGTVLLGELHGTREAPAFLADLSCLAAGRGLRVVVLLEVSVEEEGAFARYLASDGTASDRQRLLATPFWQTEHPDGRSSLAMADLLERMRRLARAGYRVEVRGLNVADPHQDGNRGMADRVLKARKEVPGALLVALAGNNHTRVGPFDSGSHRGPHQSMGEHLREASLPGLVSLDMTAAPGTFWGNLGIPGHPSVSRPGPRAAAVHPPRRGRSGVRWRVLHRLGHRLRTGREGPSRRPGLSFSLSRGLRVGVKRRDLPFRKEGAPMSSPGKRPPASRPGVRVAIVVSTVLLSLTAGRAGAQTGTSVVQGVAVDAISRRPVAEAVVTVTSPALQGAQTVLTDGSGFYRLASLPPGQYTVRIDRDGYDSYEQSRISIRTDVTFRVNVYLVPRRVEGQVEEIEITESPPTIDVGSSSVTTTFAEETIRRLPLSRPDGGGNVRSYEAIAASAPQAKSDAYGASISGTTSPENRYLIDGLSVNDAAYSTGTTPLSSEFLKEVNVVTGGYLPEYGRATGGIINATVKSGSNAVRGSAWTNFSPGFLEGATKNVFEEASTVHAPRARLDFISDVGADVGLPLVRDRLWLYLGVLGSTARHERSRSLHATQVDAAGMPLRDENGRTLRTPIPGTEQTFDVVRNTMQAVGKLSYSPSANHSLSLTAIATPARSHGVGGSLEGSIDVYEGQGRSDQLNNLIKWTATTPGKRLTFETTLGWHHDSGAGLPGDGSLPGAKEGMASRPLIVYRRSRPGYHAITEFEDVPNAEAYCGPPGPMRAVRCPVTTYSTGGAGYVSTTSQNRLQLRTAATWLAQALGHHVVKVGVDVERVTSDLHKAVGGGIGFQESSDGTAFSIGGNYGYLMGPDEVLFADSVRAEVMQWGIGAFAQNSWSILDKVTLNLGVRYDSEYLYDNEGRLGMALPHQLAPRVGVIYDPTQAGRSRMFGSFARYYQQVPLDLADRALSAEAGVFGTANASACDPARSGQAGGLPRPQQLPAHRRRQRPGSGLPPHRRQHHADRSRPEDALRRRAGARRRIPAPAREPSLADRHAPAAARHGGGHEHRRGSDLLHREPGSGHRRQLPGGAPRIRRHDPGLHQGVPRQLAGSGQLHAGPAAGQHRRPLPPGDRPARPQHQLRLRSDQPAAQSNRTAGHRQPAPAPAGGRL